MSNLLPLKSYLNRTKAFVALVLIIGFSNSKVKAQINLPPDFVHSFIGITWDNPVGITYDANGRGYVWERGGKVWIIDTNGVKLSNPLINISDEVGNWRAHGMLGFTLDPNFLTNGYIYLYYAVDRYALLNWGLPGYNPNTSITHDASIGRITRYTADAATGFTTVNLNTRLVLLGETKSTGIALLHESHGVGSLVFGRDGSLLVSSGDGASYSVVDTGSAFGTYWAQALADSIISPKENIGNLRSQLVDCLNGKILRLNPANGDGLPTNPYYDAAHPRSAKSRVWTVGLRNPFRITIQPNTGSTDITAGQPGTIMHCEVGWATWEETNMIPHGGMNLGWPFFEGINSVPSFDSSKIYNMDAPNPLYGTGNCNKPYFYFNDLIKQASLNSSTAVFKNPCDTSQIIPSTIPVFIHTPPIVTWRHHQNITKVPVLTATTTIAQSIGGTSSVTGTPFAGNCSVAGTFYNNIKFPASYNGSYFNADYGENWIKQFTFNSSMQLTGINSFADSVGEITCLTVNPKSGCLVYVTLPNAVHQICYDANVNLPPTAKIILSDTANYGASPLTLHFNGSQSFDPENALMSYSWKFGDGTSSSGKKPTHTFTVAAGTPKKFTVKLTVTDSTGQKGVDSIIVSVNNTPPQVHITSPLNGSFYQTTSPSVVNCTANVTDAEHADAALTYKWVTILHHNNHEHPEPSDNAHITTTIFSPDGCDEPYYYEEQLTVTDPAGLSGADTVYIYPRCAVPDLSFTVDKTASCAADTVHFINTSFNGLTYQWSFSGGTVLNSNQEKATVYFPATGFYTVTLIGCNSIGCDTLIKTNYIHIGNPAVNITSSGITSICNGDSVLLTANTADSPVTYKWFFNNVAIAASNKSTYYAKQAGNYKVTVALPGKCGGTSNTISLAISPSINTSISSNKISPICYTDSATLSLVSQAGATYAWFKNGQPILSATGFVYKAFETGIYTAKITIGNCAAITAAINLMVSPDVTMSVSKYSICNDSALLSVPFDSQYKYVWKKNGTAIVGAIGNTYYASQPAKYFVTVRDSQQCLRSSVKANIVVACRQMEELNGTQSFIQKLNVKPNPADQTATLTMESAINKHLKITLVDFTGKVVLADLINVEKGSYDFSIDIANLSNGLYQILITDNSSIMHLKLAVFH